MPNVKRIINSGRRILPASTVPLLVRARRSSYMSNPREIERAQRNMRFVLEKARPDADIDTATQRSLELMLWRAELRWHPELITNQRVEGVEHLTAAQRRGGVVLSFMHHGQYDGALASIARASGRPLTVFTAAPSFLPSAPDWLKQHLRIVRLSGTAVPTTIGSKGVIERLRQGETVVIATDVPGSTPMRFLGRDLIGSFGAARLAREAGVPVVMFTSHDGGKPVPYLRVSEPLEPAAFSTAHELLDAMLAHHERAILEFPEAYHFPVTRWGHPDGAENFSGWETRTV